MQLVPVRKFLSSLSSLSSHSLMSEKDSERGMHSLSDSTTLGGTGLVSSSNVIGHSSSTSTPSKEGSIVSTYNQNVASHPQIFRLHTWLLCNNKCKCRAFLSQLPDESIQRRDLPPTICMITVDILAGLVSQQGSGFLQSLCE